MRIISCPSTIPHLTLSKKDFFLALDLYLTRLIIFFLCLTCAAYTDLKQRSIPNWITLSGTCAGFLLGAVAQGYMGIIQSLAGWILGFFPFYILYKKKGIGAGDVKLMAMVGTLGGVKILMLSYLYTSLIGFLMACHSLLQAGQIRNGFLRSWQLFLKLFGVSSKPLSRPDSEVVLTIPYGAAIAAGSYMAYFTMMLK